MECIFRPTHQQTRILVAQLTLVPSLVEMAAALPGVHAPPLMAPAIDVRSPRLLQFTNEDRALMSEGSPVPALIMNSLGVRDLLCFRTACSRTAELVSMYDCRTQLDRLPQVNSKRLLSAMRTAFPSVVHLRCDLGREDVEIATFALIATFKTVDLICCSPIGDDAIRILAPCLSNALFRDTGKASITTLCAFKKLRGLEMHNCKWIDDAAVSCLSGLISIKLTNCGLTGQGLAASASTLQQLTLDKCMQLTTLPPSLPHLRELRLLYCAQLRPTGVPFLPMLQLLKVDSMDQLAPDHLWQRICTPITRTGSSEGPVGLLQGGAHHRRWKGPPSLHTVILSTDSQLWTSVPIGLKVLEFTVQNPDVAPIFDIMRLISPLQDFLEDLTLCGTCEFGRLNANALRLREFPRLRKVQLSFCDVESELLTDKPAALQMLNVCPFTMDDLIPGEGISVEAELELFAGMPWLLIPAQSHYLRPWKLLAKKRYAIELARLSSRKGRPIKYLDLSGCKAGTDSVLQQVQGLKFLHMGECPAITINGLLAQTELQRLVINYPDRKHEDSTPSTSEFSGNHSGLSLDELVNYILATPTLSAIRLNGASSKQMSKLAARLRKYICGPPGVAGCVRGSKSGDVRVRVGSRRQIPSWYSARRASTPIEVPGYDFMAMFDPSMDDGCTIIIERY